jgi:hypothetical protein
MYAVVYDTSHVTSLNIRGDINVSTYYLLKLLPMDARLTFMIVKPWNMVQFVYIIKQKYTKLYSKEDRYSQYIYKLMLLFGIIYLFIGTDRWTIFILKNSLRGFFVSTVDIIWIFCMYLCDVTKLT